MYLSRSHQHVGVSAPRQTKTVPCLLRGGSPDYRGFSFFLPRPDIGHLSPPVIVKQLAWAGRKPTLGRERKKVSFPGKVGEAGRRAGCSVTRPALWSGIRFTINTSQTWQWVFSTIKHEYTLLSFERDLIAVPLGYGCSEKADESTLYSEWSRRVAV